jgi:hypothetical protein
VTIGLLRRSISGGSSNRTSQARASKHASLRGTLCPPGQSKKAIGQESPIGPCIATHRVDNRQACCFRNDGRRHNSEMEPQERTIDSPLRMRRRITTSAPEQDHSRSGASIGRAECREKKSGIEPKGRFFLLTFPLIGHVRLGTIGTLRYRLAHCSGLYAKMQISRIPALPISSTTAAASPYFARASTAR